MIGPLPEPSRDMPTTTVPKIAKGTKFRSVIADSNALWEVTRSRGRGVWEARVTDSEDYAGEVKVFRTEDITRSLAMANFFAKNGDERAAFYEGLALGSTVHYHNSFGQFVRCEVVIGTTTHNQTPHKCLRPYALVGTWSAHDLPRRDPDGSIYAPYHVKQIQEGRCFAPNVTTIYESGKVAGSVDPRSLPVLDLTVPAPTAEEEATAKLWLAVEAAKAALSDYQAKDPETRLLTALKIITEAL